MDKTKWTLGIDLGGTGVKMALVSPNGRLGAIRRFRTRTHVQPATVIAEIASHARDLLRAPNRGRVIAIGVAVAGDIDADKGIVRLSPNLGWRQVPLKALLLRPTQSPGRGRLPVFVENDANAAAWGAYVMETKRRAKNLLCVTLGTGVGGGMVIGGRLFRGVTGSAGEIGHLTLYPEGLSCSCGNRGCLERYVGGKAISDAALRAVETQEQTMLLDMAEGRTDAITSLMIQQAAHKGDPLSRRLFDEAGRALGTGLASLVNILNPDWIVLAGGVSRAGALLLSPLKTVLKARAFPTPLAAVRLTVSRRDQDLGIVGAGLLAHAHAAP